MPAKSGMPRAGYITNDGEDGWEQTAPADWARCRDCGRLGIFHETGFYRLRPCGHADGNNHLRGIEPVELSRMWAEAGNRTQWRVA